MLFWQIEKGVSPFPFAIQIKTELLFLSSSETLLLRFFGSGLLALLAEAVDAFDDEHDGENDEADGPDHLEPVTPGSTGGSNELDLVDDGHAERGQGCAEHEGHREEEHLVVSADLAEPAADSQHGDTGKQLVGSAEHAPDLGQAQEADAAANNDHDERGDHRVGEELGSAGQLIAGLSFGNEELCEHVAGKAGAGVKRGKSKDGDGERQQRVGDIVSLVAEDSCDHGSNTAGEDRRRRAELHDIVTGLDLVPHNADCDEGDDAESRLDDHGAVADGLGILLGVDLLGGGAGSDERMEAGASAAGDRDEQSREERGGAGEVVPAAECGDFDGHAGADDTDESNDHHAVEQEGAQIVTRLEQDPDRQQRSNRDIDSNEDDPEGTAAVDTDVEADENDGNDADDTDDRSRADGNVLAVHEVTEDNGNDNEEERGRCGGCLGIDFTGGEQGVGRVGKCAGNNGGEGCNNENQNEQCEDREEDLCTLAHAVLDDFADRAAVVADGSEQSTKVMHCAEEDAAEDAPEEYRNPAENSCLDRSVDRACACDGREMVAHQNGRVGRNEVLSVVAGVCRGLFVGVNTPLLCKPGAIENIAADQQSDCEKKDN